MEALKDLFNAQDNKLGDDLGQRATANALIKLRELLNKLEGK